MRGDGIYEAHVEQVGDGHICHRHHRRCVCKTKLSVVKFSRLNAKKCIFYTFWAICCNFWVFFLNFGCKILGLKNSTSVKEIHKYSVYTNTVNDEMSVNLMKCYIFEKPFMHGCRK